jgi:hypothetical protein
MDQQPRAGSVELAQLDRKHGYFHRLQFKRDLLPGQLVRRSPTDLLRRNRRRSLPKRAAKPIERCLQFLPPDRHSIRGPRHRALAIVAVGSHAQPNHAVVALLIRRKESSQPRGVPHQQRQNPGRHRIQSPQMPDAPLPGQPPHLAHHIVGRPTRRLIHHNGPALNHASTVTCPVRAIAMLT